MTIQLFGFPFNMHPMKWDDLILAISVVALPWLVYPVWIFYILVLSGGLAIMHFLTYADKILVDMFIEEHPPGGVGAANSSLLSKAIGSVILLWAGHVWLGLVYWTMIYITQANYRRAVLLEFERRINAE